MNRNAPPALTWPLDRWRLLLLLLLFLLLLYGALRWPLLPVAPADVTTGQDVATEQATPQAAAPAPVAPTTGSTENPAPETTQSTSAELSIQPPSATAVDGSLAFSGTAGAAERVLLWVNGETVGEGSVNAQQRWQLEISTALPPGRYVAQAAALDEAGAVIMLSTPITFTTR